MTTRFSEEHNYHIPNEIQKQSIFTTKIIIVAV